MKEIKLQSISILNFKGIRNLEITFNTEGMTTIPDGMPQENQLYVMPFYG